MVFQAPRGTSDILPEDQRYWRFFREKVEEITRRFGYERLDTPIFEDAGLFVRGVGESTDIVEKETYTFEDRGGNLLTLRPEGTAPVCRAYLEHGMHNLAQPVRQYYLLPGFRYERPQAGRSRQHHQFGIEVIGEADASVDAEVIEVGWRFLESVGLRELALNINTIGDSECRPGYIRELRSYYLDHVDRLCPDCKRRLETNPLRLLDCKQESCQPIIAEAPHSSDHLCQSCVDHWADLMTHLECVGLEYEIDHRLVRGLDYYTRTVFEVTPPTEGSQTVLFGGGRYDGLIQELGGKPTPGIGYGMGAERVIMNMREQEVEVPDYRGTKVMVVHMGDAAKMEAVKISSSLRNSGIAAIAAPSGRSLRSQMRYASSVYATHAVIIGDDELQKGVVQLRDLVKSEQQEIKPEDLMRILHDAN